MNTGCTFTVILCWMTLFYCFLSGKTCVDFHFIFIFSFTLLFHITLYKPHIQPLVSARVVGGVLKKPLSVWLSCSLISSTPLKKVRPANQRHNFFNFYCFNVNERNPSCDWHKTPTKAQWIHCDLNPRCDTSSPLNMYGAGAAV